MIHTAVTITRLDVTIAHTDEAVTHKKNALVLQIKAAAHMSLTFK